MQRRVQADERARAPRHPARPTDAGRTDHEPVRRAVVLVGHGGLPRDYPRERLMQLRALEGRRRASGAAPLPEEVALAAELRHWPRTPANDPYRAGLEEPRRAPTAATGADSTSPRVQ